MPDTLNTVAQPIVAAMAGGNLAFFLAWIGLFLMVALAGIGSAWGTVIGGSASVGAMKKRESRLLENSAKEANSTLISYLPGPGAAGVGYRVAGFLEPCISGSGDFFDVFSAGEDTTAFYSLDVMGHGIIASLLAFSLHDLLPLLGRNALGRVPSPSDVLRALYARYFRKGSSRTMFFTITYGILQNSTGAYRVVRGGHLPVVHICADGEIQIHSTKGTAVGVVEDADIEEARGVLDPGDRLFLATDGLAEALGNDGSMDAALARISAFAAPFRNVDLSILVDAFKRQAKKETEDRIKEDDMSLLVIERQRDLEPVEALPV